jgi:hypothetical protein
MYMMRICYSICPYIIFRNILQKRLPLIIVVNTQISRGVPIKWETKRNQRKRSVYFFISFCLLFLSFHFLHISLFRWFRFISFPFRWFRFVSFRFRWFRFVSFRFEFSYWKVFQLLIANQLIYWEKYTNLGEMFATYRKTKYRNYSIIKPYQYIWVPSLVRFWCVSHVSWMCIKLWF